MQNEICLTFKLYIAGVRFDMERLFEVLCAQKLLCNVAPMSSVVKDTNDKFSVQSGSCVDIFSATPAQIIKLWMSLRWAIGIQCVYMICATYEGCITNWPKYLDYAKKTGQARLFCSEYSEGELKARCPNCDTPVQQDQTGKQFCLECNRYLEPVQPVKNGDSLYGKMIYQGEF